MDNLNVCLRKTPSIVGHIFTLFAKALNKTLSTWQPKFVTERRQVTENQTNFL